MGGFEDRGSCVVVDVGAWSDADPSHARGQRVRDIITIEVHRRDDGVFRRTREDLLEERVSDDVLDDDLLAGLWVVEVVPRSAVEWGGAEELA